MKNSFRTIFTLFAFASALPCAQAAQKTPSPKPPNTETATLAAGCFWGTEEFFRKIPGVIATQVGYSGGKMKNPGYEDVSGGDTGHAESLELKFDPAKVSFHDLLILFFKMHDPTTANRQGNDSGTQYRSAIFYHGDAQKKVAEEVMSQIERSKAWKAPLTTELAAAGPFYPAEDYHQKYLVKHPGGYDNHFLRELSFDGPKANPSTGSKP